MTISRSYAPPAGTPGPALGRTLGRALAVTLLAVLIAECSTRPGPGSFQTSHAPEQGATNHTILIATTRERATKPATYFTGERAGHTD